MKMRTWVALVGWTSFGAAALLVGALAVARELGFDFIAPTVPSTAAAPNEQGLIVYDAGADVFRGRGALDWQSLTAGAAEVPVGTILPFAGPIANIPAGYRLCDGSVVDANAGYLALVTAIEDSWGDAGDVDPATVNLPDLRGLFLRGSDNGRGADPNANARISHPDYPGSNSGDQVGSYQVDEFRRHGHPWRQVVTDDVVSDGNGGAIMTDQNGSHTTRNPFTGTTLGNNPNQSIGGAGEDETRPSNVSVNYIIKV
ncbi:MAG: tail fiber protein [Bdellovibrionales bacterium]|nr:tail fiber protein [Bdellovibrionales bacterium]